MRSEWEHYRHLTPLYEAPLCLHQLGRERVKVAAELLALTTVDCAAVLPRDTCRALQSALAVVRRLQGVLGRTPPCGCRQGLGTEEERDATAPDYDG